MRVLRQSVVLWAGLLSAQGLSAAAAIASARALSPAEFGLVAAAVGLGLLAATVVDFGVNSLIVRILASGGPPRTFTRALRAKLVIGATLATVGGLWAVLAESPSSLRAAYLFAALYVGILVVASTLLVPIRAQQRIDAVASLQVMEKAIALSVTVGMLSVGLAVEAFPAGLAAGALASCAGALLLLQPAFRRLSPISVLDMVQIWRESSSFGVASVAAQIQRADVAVVAAIAGPTASGIYAVPTRLLSVLTALPAAYSTTIYPRLVIGHTNAVIPAAAFLFGLTILLLGALFVSAPAVLEFAVGRGYSEAVPILRVYIVASALASINQPLSVGLQARHQERYVAQIVAIGATLGLIIVAIGASVSGALGAAFGFFSLQAFAFVLMVARAVSLARGSRTQSPWDVQREPLEHRS